MVNVRPHPGPLPQGEGEPFAVLRQITTIGARTAHFRITRDAQRNSLSSGERARVRAGVTPLLIQPRFPSALALKNPPGPPGTNPESFRVTPLPPRSGGHPACRRAVASSPAETTTRKPEPLEFSNAIATSFTLSGRQDAALYVRPEARRYSARFWTAPARFIPLHAISPAFRR
jgi:hypothetical protein